MTNTPSTPGLRRDGTLRRDVLTGTANDDTLLGYAGDDDLRGGLGHDVLYGGPGADVLGTPDSTGAFAEPGDPRAPEAGNDTFLGGDGNDQIGGGAGNDLAFGGADNDFMTGGIGDDTLRGQDGQDRLFGEAGADFLLGGAGDDTLSGGSFYFDDFDFGDPDTDMGRDTLFGGAGNDAMRGIGGDDLLAGGAGRDTLLGNDGADRLLGGTEADTLVGGAGADTLLGGDGDDLLVGGLVALAGPFAALPDTDPGGDILAGGAGRDTLIGGGGADRLLGGPGDDLLRGGAGADTLAGGPGADTLTGGAGDDIFVLMPGGATTITDFRPAAGRTVTITFDGLEAGTLVPQGLGGLAFGAVTDPASGVLEDFNPVTSRDGNSVRSTAGTLGISDPEGRAFVVEGGTVIKASNSNASVHTFRDGARLESFYLPFAADRPDLGTVLAGMQPADHIEIEGRTNIGNIVMSVPLDSISLRFTDAAEADLLRVAGPAQAAGLLASAIDVEGGVAMAFGGIEVTLLGQTAAAATLDWFG